MSTFEISRGYVEIKDGVFRVDTSPLEGLNRLYRHRKPLLFSSIIVWVTTVWLLFTESVYGSGMRNLSVVFTVLILLLLSIEKIRIATGNKKHTEIPLSSIERIEFDEFTATKLSRINVIYAEDGEKKTHNVWIRIFGIGSEKRLENAISVIQSAGIEIEQGERAENI